MTLIKKGIWWLCSRINPVNTAKRMGVQIGENVSFAGMPDFGSEPYLVKIGNHVRTSSQVTFITHDGATWCFRENQKYKKILRFNPIIIGNNCFIVKKATIMPGVHIGDNCIIGACALVTKDVPSNSIVGGVPAKIIGNTFEYAEKCLLESPEWDEKAMKNNKKAELLRIFSERMEQSGTKV